VDGPPDDPEQATVEAPPGSPLGRVPVRGPGRLLEAAAVVVAGFLVLAIVKPWDIGAAPGPTVPPPTRTLPPVSVAPEATEDVTPEGLAAPICLGTEAWMVATVETWQLMISGTLETQRVRVWRSIDPVAIASGPEDGAIPVAAIASMEVDSLGWCAPSSGPQRATGQVDVTMWRLGSTGPAVEVPLRRVAPGAGDTPFAALYKEVTDCVVGFGCSGSAVPLLAPTWASGRYVLRYAEPATGRTWWFGADLQIVPRPPVPDAGPTPRA
jgi:hypothetical protein